MGETIRQSLNETVTTAEGKTISYRIEGVVEADSSELHISVEAPAPGRSDYQQRIQRASFYHDEVRLLLAFLKRYEKHLGAEV